MRSKLYALNQDWIGAGATVHPRHAWVVLRPGFSGT